MTWIKTDEPRISSRTAALGGQQSRIRFLPHPMTQEACSRINPAGHWSRELIRNKPKTGHACQGYYSRNRPPLCLYFSEWWLPPNSPKDGSPLPVYTDKRFSSLKQGHSFFSFNLHRSGGNDRPQIHLAGLPLVSEILSCRCPWNRHTDFQKRIRQEH